MMDENLCSDVLENTDIVDIWGINKRSAVNHKLGITNARQLREIDPVRPVRY